MLTGSEGLVVELESIAVISPVVLTGGTGEGTQLELAELLIVAGDKVGCLILVVIEPLADIDVDSLEGADRLFGIEVPKVHILEQVLHFVIPIIIGVVGFNLESGKRTEFGGELRNSALVNLGTVVCIEVHTAECVRITLSGVVLRVVVLTIAAVGRDKHDTR